MSVIALTAAHGAPGVTTTALALVSAWGLARPDRRVLLVDADPAGSGLLAGPLRSGVPASAGVSLLAAVRPPLSVEQVVECCVALDEASRRMVLPGVADPVQARPLAATWSALVGVARDLSSQGVDVVVDAGRLGHRYEPTPWLVEADLVAIVVHSDLASVLPASAAVRGLTATRAAHAALVGLVVDPGGYTVGEISAALGTGEVLSIARDEWAARALLGGAGQGIRFDRSPLMRSARAVVERLAQLVPDPEPAVTR